MRVFNVENITRTATNGAYDCTVTYQRSWLDKRETHPFTYNAGDMSELTVAIRDWLTARKVNLASVAASYVPALPTAAQIKREAARRIDMAWPTHTQLNVMRRGTQEDINNMGAEIDALRQKSRALEGNPVVDYQDDKHWI